MNPTAPRFTVLQSLRPIFPFLAVGGLIACGTLRDIGPESPAHTHTPGFADPAVDSYHGTFLAAVAYDYKSCRSCHGATLQGVGDAVACAQCHVGGAEACGTCHGQPPTTGAHAAHYPRFACETCHPVPARYDEPGHLQPRDAARVVLSGLARAGAIARAPRYENGRCVDSYCHGAQAPSWTGGPTQAACGTCHTNPPTGHYQGACVHCHAEVVDAQNTIRDARKHVDGRANAVDLSRGCTACHGPPQELGGAHTAHLLDNRVGRAVPCVTCHVVPERVDAPGHLDDIPGAEVIFSGLARAGGANPALAEGRCGNTYCHGATLRGGTYVAPTWTDGPRATACGACHGVPYPNHYGGVCADCHGAVVDRAYRIVRPALHMNGRVDFGDAP